jgi:hypothetical protein
LFLETKYHAQGLCFVFVKTKILILKEIGAIGSFCKDLRFSLATVSIRRKFADVVSGYLKEPKKDLVTSPCWEKPVVATVLFCIFT